MNFIYVQYVTLSPKVKQNEGLSIITEKEELLHYAVVFCDCHYYGGFGFHGIYRSMAVIAKILFIGF